MNARTWISGVLSVVLSGCGTGAIQAEGSLPADARLVIADTSVLTLEQGAELRLYPSIVSSSSTPEIVALQWTSSNPEVASIDVNGITRGLTPGVTRLSATAYLLEASGTLESSVEVRVVDDSVEELPDSGCYPSIANRLSATDGWTSEDSDLTDGQFGSLTIAARVDSTSANSVVGVSAGAATGFRDLLANVRFAPSGILDVRDSSSYSARVDFPYEAATWYTFRLEFDYANETYSAYVRTCDNEEILLLENAVYRDGTPRAPMRFTSAWSSTAAEVEVAVLNFETTSHSVVPPAEEEVDEDDPISPIDQSDGFPDASSTGFAAAGLSRSDLEVSEKNGSLWRIDEPGVYSNFRHSGGILVEANNVTLKNCQVSRGGGFVVQNNATGLVIENCKLEGGENMSYGNLCAASVGRSNYTLRRVDISGCADGLKAAGNYVVVEDSYIHDLFRDCGPDDCTHNDSVQVGKNGGVGSLTVRNTTFMGRPCSGNTHFQIGGSATDVLIEGNYFYGYHGIFKTGGTIGTMRVVDNTYQGSSSRGAFSAKPGLHSTYGNTVVRSGNRFESGEAADSDPRDRNTYVCEP
ncbi:MAG: hypothetical protein AAF654_00835 [Myxococcota bacterium]